MDWITLCGIAVGLSMDACAVAICKGLNMRRVEKRFALIIAFAFGFFQGLMPLIGWALGKQFESYIARFDHWIAFILLGIIGMNMIRESREQDDCGCRSCSILDLKELLMMAIATSIDALAVGITFACLGFPLLGMAGGQISITAAVMLIGCTTFAISLAGVYIGNFFGIRLKSKAELAGGIILILIGSKILLEHLGIL